MKKILLIDDDQDITELIKIVLGDQYCVEAQADHFDISEKLESFAPDLVLLDNWVGKMNASEIIEDLKTENGYNIVPVVLFSAHQDIEKIASKIKADAYLTKPFNLDELYNCINQLLN